MRMNGFGNCFNRDADFKRKSKLRYHIRCAGTHELCADEISVRIGNQLCNAESFAHYHCSAVACNIEAADFVFNALLLCFFFADADKCNFGSCINAGRNNRIIHLYTLLPACIRRSCKALCACNMRKLNLAGYIADRIDVFDICAAIIVDVHKRAVHFDSDIFKPDVCRHCAAADGNNAAASLGCFFDSVEFVRYGDFFAAVDACYLGIVDNSNFFAFEYPC